MSNNICTRMLERKINKIVGTRVDDLFANMLISKMQEKYKINISFDEKASKLYKALGGCYRSGKDCFGIFLNPVILEDLGKFRYVLAHELAHIKFLNHTYSHMKLTEKILNEIEKI